jgi:ABC-type enterochelin transport system substrate-binding protein
MLGALRIVALIALLLGAVALGACGGNDDREAKNTYVRELNAAQQEFAANASKVSDNGRSGSVGQYRLTVERFEKTIERFASKLRAIQVPSAVKAEHEQLIAALTRFGTDFQKAAGVLKNPSAGAVSQAKSDLTSATQRANARIEAAAAAIDSKLKHT